MEPHKIPQISYKFILITIAVLVILVGYSLRNLDIGEVDDEEETTVSLCQIRVQFDGSHVFDDRTLLALLSTLKMHDFFIGQPVWGPTDTVLYLCEHRLKAGFRQSILDRDLHNVIKNAPRSSGRLAWSCA